MAAVKVAVLGLGGVTQSVHLPLLTRLHDELQVVALADLSAERASSLSQLWGIGHWYTSLADLLAARDAGEIELDGVLIATTGTHGPDALTCARAGLAVLAEKPLSMNAAEIDALAAESDALVQVGYMKEYDHATAAARAELEGKRIRSVSVEVLHPTSQSQLVYARLLPAATDLPEGAIRDAIALTESAVTEAIGPDVPDEWRDLYERIVLGSIIHDVSLLRHLIGEVTDVESAATWGGRPGDVGSVQVIGTLAGEGATAPRFDINWHYLPDYPDYRETVTVHHDSGSVQLVFGIPYLLNAPTVLTVVAADDAGGEVRSEHRWNQSEAFASELLAFAALIRDGQTPNSGPEQARADLHASWRVMAALAHRHGFAIGGQAGQWLEVVAE